MDIIPKKVRVKPTDQISELGFHKMNIGVGRCKIFKYKLFHNYKDNKNIYIYHYELKRNHKKSIKGGVTFDIR